MNDLLQEFMKRLNVLLAPYRGKVEWGNVREKISHWQEGEHEMTNVAVTYESPGGSTNQINVSFDHQRQIFRALNEQTGEEEDVAEVDVVVERVTAHVLSIPDKRKQRLNSDMERWLNEGATQGMILGKLNQLLKMQDLKGGSITLAELQEATRYLTQLVREKSKKSG
jgi:hypothetical protein